ncbi:MAG: class II fructose-bisphosphate aldolase [Mycobacterium kyogaense]
MLAFNVITLEHAEGIALGVERAGAAALIQISENTVRFHGGALAPITAACAQIASASAAPLALHLDHIQDSALLDEAVATAPRTRCHLGDDRCGTSRCRRERGSDSRFRSARPRRGVVRRGRARSGGR